MQRRYVKRCVNGVPSKVINHNRCDYTTLKSEDKSTGAMRRLEVALQAIIALASTTLPPTVHQSPIILLLFWLSDSIPEQTRALANGERPFCDRRDDFEWLWLHSRRHTNYMSRSALVMYERQRDTAYEGCLKLCLRCVDANEGS